MYESVFTSLYELVQRLRHDALLDLPSSVHDLVWLPVVHLQHRHQVVRVARLDRLGAGQARPACVGRGRRRQKALSGSDSSFDRWRIRGRMRPNPGWKGGGKRGGENFFRQAFYRMAKVGSSFRFFFLFLSFTSADTHPPTPYLLPKESCGGGEGAPDCQISFSQKEKKRRREEDP